MMWYTLAGAAVLLAVIECNSAQPNETHRDVVQSINSFSTSLYKVLSENPGNLVVSPFSVETVLAMVLVGLRGDTAQHVSSALHLPDSRLRVEHGFKSLHSSLQKSENVTLEIANKVYIQNGFKIKDEFHQSTANNFHSAADQVDFATKTEETRKTINQWAAGKTNNKIQEIIPEGSLDPATYVMLLNAIYFKGLWNKEFNKSRTSPEIFRLDTKSAKKVPFMHTTEHFPHGRFNELQAEVLKLPYQGKRVSLLIFLPDELDGLRNLEINITSLNITYILNNLRSREVSVTLPRFKIESSFNLISPLKKLGMEELFRPGADFSGMTDEEIYINLVLQKAFIEVNEEGTEAAAVTVGGAIPVSLPPPIKIFKADHPFVFTIVDEDNDTILFMGRVAEP